MSNCTHLDDLTRLQPPRLSQSVHREECTQCFDNQDTPSGIDVCLSCFNGGCLDNERHHARTHVKKSGHTFTLNIKRKLRPSSQRSESDSEPPAKMTKLAIIEDQTEEDKYDHLTTIKCWKCDPISGAEIPSSHPKATALIEGVMQSMSSARKSEVKAWEEELLPCEHTLTLHQSQGQGELAIAASGHAHCSSCVLTENLWLCLICGSLGCGRAQFGGIGGNGHGLLHYETTGHGVSVKLGTITPEGGADIYCYICNDSKLDPDLATHLSTFGINVQTQKKTEKSMTELQIEHNLKFDFSLTGEDGKALEPVFGPGLTGLSNLGNSCYMASVLQTLFSLPAFQSRYLSSTQHSESCPEQFPADCIECQMRKIGDGLLSGRYSRPAHYNETAPISNSPTPVFQEGIKPTGFKALIGKGHEEFSTMKQQDSEEFFTHLITVLRRDAHKRSGSDANVEDPTQIFSYGMEQKLQCGTCKKVRYRVDTMDVVSVAVPAVEKGKDVEGKVLYEEVQLRQCLDSLLGNEALDYACPSCQQSVFAIKQAKFASLPEVLVIHAKKFQLVNWVPAKLDIPLILPSSDELEFDARYLGRGLQPDETELPNDNQAAVATLPKFDEAAIAQLESFGFPLIRCQKALLATGNSNAEAAVDWLFAHSEDPDIDSPIQPVASSGQASSGPEPSEDQISMIVDMGFSPAQARKALRETGGNPERAIDWLFNHPDDNGEEASAPSQPASTGAIPGSTNLPAKYKLKAFISHKGPSVHSGHYVAHIRVGNGWVLFNDEKVVKADEESVKELKKLAYLYVFERA